MIPSEHIVSEVNQDPAGLGYAGQTIRQKYDLLMNPNRVVREGRDTGEILLELSLNGVWRKLITAKDNQALPAQVRVAVIQFMDLINKLPYLRFKNNPDMVEVVAALQLLGVITTQESIDFLALGNVIRTRAQEVWGKDASVGIGYFARALQPEKFALAEMEFAEKESVLHRLSRGEEVD